jgi:hypothetical protein
MNEAVSRTIQTAVTRWARQTFATEELFIRAIAPDGEEEGRFLVDVAARPVGYWLVAEVWLDERGRVETINNLGEGLPLDNAAWPWPEDTLS